MSRRHSHGIRSLASRLAWIAGGTAFSRGSVALALLGSSLILPLSEFGLVGVYLASALMVTQTVSYSFSLYILKSGGMAGWAPGKLARAAVAISAACAITFVAVSLAFVQKMDAGYALAFAGYVFGNSCLQCTVASMQGRGNFARPTTISGIVTSSAALLSVVAAWAIGGVAMVTTLAVGFVA